MKNVAKVKREKKNKKGRKGTKKLDHPTPDAGVGKTTHSISSLCFSIGEFLLSNNRVNRNQIKQILCPLMRNHQHQQLFHFSVAISDRNQGYVPVE